MFNILDYIDKDIEFNCKKCGVKNNFNFDDYYSIDSFESSSCERSMGLETQHTLNTDIECQSCNSQNILDILIVEYPVGSYNFSEMKINDEE